MAALSREEAEALWARFMREESQEGNPINVNKNVLKDAFLTCAGFAESKQVELNQSFSVAARTGMNARQKAKAFNLVIERMYQLS